MNRVLVTGATGFVGSALVLRLSAENVQVRGVVRRFGEQAGCLDVASVGEVGAKTDWRDALTGVDVLVHLAAVTAADQQTDAAALFQAVNVDGARRLAEQAAAAGVRRLVFMSSIKVHGESTDGRGPFTEDDPPASQDAYGRSKQDAEQALCEIARNTGLEVVILRPPLVYGPGVGGNFSAIMRWVQRGIPLPLGAVTENRRSLIALDNLVDLIVTCLDHPRVAGETFLVSDGEDVSTADLLRGIGEALGKPLRLIPVPVSMLRAGAALLGKRAMADRLLGSLQVDSSKVRDVLGWKPPIGLDEGLRRAVGRGR